MNYKLSIIVIIACITTIAIGVLFFVNLSKNKEATDQTPYSQSMTPEESVPQPITTTTQEPKKEVPAPVKEIKVPPPPPPQSPPPPPAPPTKSITISADDYHATPSSVDVTKGTILSITFNVSPENVYYGGLDFRSPVINSGTIYATQSKTITFTVDHSFEFTPYWPSSNVKKNYTISIIVQ